MKNLITFFSILCLILPLLSAQEIKIGTIVALTGQLAVYGKDMSQGILQAVEEANAQNGVNGKKIVLIREDDSGKPENTVAALKKLVIRDKVVGIIGPLTSNSTLAIAPLAQRTPIPLIVPSATNDKITEAGDFIFRICYTDSFQGKTLAGFAHKQLKSQTAAIFFDKGNDYSFGLKETFEKTFSAFGGKVIAESYASADKDFNAQISKIKPSKPDVIFIPDYHNVVILLTKQIRAAGLTVPLLGTDSWNSIAKSHVPELAGSFYSDHFSLESSPQAKVFWEAYSKRWKKHPNVFAALGYDAAKLLTSAMIKADQDGKLTSRGIRDAIAAQRGEFVTGKIHFDSKHTATKPLVMMEITKNTDGELVSKYKTTINP